VVDVLKRHFPNLKTVAAESGIPFEASQADTTLWSKTVGWMPEYTLETAIPEMIGSALLVTSASRKVPLIRAVKEAAMRLSPEVRVIAGDRDPGAVARYVADHFWKMPDTTDEQLPALLAGCRQRHVTA